MLYDTRCIELILKEFPGFNKAWQEHLDWWGEETPGLCSNMSLFSDYVLGLLQQKIHDNGIKGVFFY